MAATTAPIHVRVAQTIAEHVRDGALLHFTEGQDLLEGHGVRSRFRIATRRSHVVSVRCGEVSGRRQAMENLAAQVLPELPRTAP